MTSRGRAPRGHAQIPRSLLHSPDHSGPAVWTWAMHETLMPHGLDGGRAPAIARRRFLAEHAGTSTTAYADARRQARADVAHGFDSPGEESARPTQA